MLKKGLIVSCQAEGNSSFNNPISILNFSLEAERGGSVGLRLIDIENIFAVKDITKLPIIGLTKTNYKNGDVWITPHFKDAKDLFDSGVDYVAMDVTGRQGYSEVNLASKLGVIVGDLSNINQADDAINNGCTILTTALSGYTLECRVDMNQPDYQLLEDLVRNYPNIPIMAEGRYWERDQVKRAFDLGAHNIVVGTAITRPHLITKRLMEAFYEK